MSTVQLDLFVNNDSTAFPTRRSATGLVPRAAKRLGYDYVAFCRSCNQTVILVGEWRPDGWTHRDTGATNCRPQDLRRHQA